ncbi:MAG: hypothetical protein U0166_00775 [Acidobacteriota bacterium]
MHLLFDHSWLRRRLSPSLRIPRLDAERKFWDALETGKSWISIEGDAGTGKSTLLDAIHEKLLSIGGNDVPLLVDAEWLGRSVDHSPLGSMVTALPTPSENPYEAITRLAGALGAGRRLVLLVDTVDVALLAGRERVAFLHTELKATGAITVTACRSYEASARFGDRDRRTIVLGDFTHDEAKLALESYVDAYYLEHPAVTRSLALHTYVDRYLGTPRLADLCRRPVTLRMLFDVYGGTLPPTDLDRTTLFREYWRRKVLVHAGTERFGSLRASSEARAALVLALAQQMILRRSDRVTDRALEQTLDESAQKAMEDLLSEGVVRVTAGRGTREYAFFHQCFREYAAARWTLDTAEGKASLAELLASVADPHSPWLDLAVEVGQQAQEVQGQHHTTEEVLAALFSAADPASMAAAARLWCHLDTDPPSTPRLEDLTADPTFLRECLTYLPDMPPLRLRRIAPDIVTAAWRRMDDKLAAIRALARVVPYSPETAQHLAWVLRLRKDIARAPGEFVVAVGVLFSAFFGILDGFAERRLNALYCRLLRGRPKALLRARLVEAVGRHIGRSNAALTLLYRWLALPEERRGKGREELAEALASALAVVPPTGESLALELSIFERGQSDAPTARTLMLWAARRRILPETVPLDRIWDVFAFGRPDRSALVGDLFLRGVATDANVEVRERLVEWWTQRSHLPPG